MALRTSSCQSPRNLDVYLALGQNLVALVNIKIAGKWVFTPLTLIIIGFDTYEQSRKFKVHGKDISKFGEEIMDDNNNFEYHFSKENNVCMITGMTL